MSVTNKGALTQKNQSIQFMQVPGGQNFIPREINQNETIQPSFRSQNIEIKFKQSKINQRNILSSYQPLSNDTKQSLVGDLGKKLSQFQLSKKISVLKQTSTPEIKSTQQSQMILTGNLYNVTPYINFDSVNTEKNIGLTPEYSHEYLYLEEFADQVTRIHKDNKMPEIINQFQQKIDFHEDYAEQSTQQFQDVNDITKLEIEFDPTSQPDFLWNDLNQFEDHDFVDFVYKPTIDFEQPRESTTILSQPAIMINYMMIFMNHKVDNQILRQVINEDETIDFGEGLKHFKLELEKIVGTILQKFKKINEMLQFILAESETIKRQMEEQTQKVNVLIEKIIQFSQNSTHGQLQQKGWIELRKRSIESYLASYELKRRMQLNVVQCRSYDINTQKSNNNLVEYATKILQEFRKQNNLFEEQFHNYILQDSLPILLLYDLNQNRVEPDSEIAKFQNNLQPFYKFFDSQNNGITQVIQMFCSSQMKFVDDIDQMIQMQTEPMNCFLRCCDQFKVLFEILPLQFKKVQSLAGYEHYNYFFDQNVQESYDKKREIIETLQNQILRCYPGLAQTSQSIQEKIKLQRENKLRYQLNQNPRYSIFESQLALDQIMQQKQVLEFNLKIITKQNTLSKNLQQMYKIIPTFEQDLLTIRFQRISVVEHFNSVKNKSLSQNDVQDLAKLKNNCQLLLNKIENFFPGSQIKELEQASSDPSLQITNQFIRLNEWTIAELTVIQQEEEEIQNQIRDQKDTQFLDIMEKHKSKYQELSQRVIEVTRWEPSSKTSNKDLAPEAREHVEHIHDFNSIEYSPRDQPQLELEIADQLESLANSIQIYQSLECIEFYEKLINSNQLLQLWKNILSTKILIHENSLSQIIRSSGSSKKSGYGELNILKKKMFLVQNFFILNEHIEQSSMFIRYISDGIEIITTLLTHVNYIKDNFVNTKSKDNQGSKVLQNQIQNKMNLPIIPLQEQSNQEAKDVMSQRTIELCIQIIEHEENFFSQPMKEDLLASIKIFLELTNL